jgi:hypothetical protein
MMAINPATHTGDCVRFDVADPTKRVLMIITVRTVDRLERKHTYTLPPGYETCMENWNPALAAVHQAMEAGRC